MLRGNPPPQHLFFSFLSNSFPSLFKKKSKKFGGVEGKFEPPEPPPPPLKYALEHNYILKTGRGGANIP